MHFEIFLAQSDPKTEVDNFFEISVIIIIYNYLLIDTTLCPRGFEFSLDHLTMTLHVMIKTAEVTLPLTRVDVCTICFKLKHIFRFPN